VEAGAPSRLDVSTPVFEGPLELLLALVEREEVDIFKVSLAKVTDEYLAEVASREIADGEIVSRPIADEMKYGEAGSNSGCALQSAPGQQVGAFGGQSVCWAPRLG